MNAPTFPPIFIVENDQAIEIPADNSFIPISDPDITLVEIEAVDAVMRSPRLSGGAAVEAFGGRSRPIWGANTRSRPPAERSAC